MAAALDYVAAIRYHAAGIFELCRGDLARAIPSCPGWSANDLQEHIVETFRGEVPGFGDDELEPDEALDRVVELLRHDSAPARGIALESAVHHWDARMAFETDFVIEPALACDGVDEFLGEAWPLWLDAFQRSAGHGETLSLRQTDGAEHWRVVLEHRPVVTHDDDPADVEVVATASDLLLWLWGRMDPPRVDGDRSVLEGIRNPQGRFLSPGY